MRSEAEIIRQIEEYAMAEPSVRAVIRTNLMPKREYQHSYEFFFVVNDLQKYEDDIFKDGITLVIDAADKESFLSRYNREQAHENVWIGDTYQKLIDKDGILPEIERLEETQTLFSEAPSEDEFLGTCNEFFWVLKTFSEYTLRKELPSAMFYLNIAVRDLLNKMLRWHIYLQHGEPVDMGILDSNMEKLLEKELFDLYKKTYPNSEYEQIWEAFDAVIKLWRKAGNLVADKCGVNYSDANEKEMLNFIDSLRSNAFKE